MRNCEKCPKEFPKASFCQSEDILFTILIVKTQQIFTFKKRTVNVWHYYSFFFFFFSNELNVSAGDHTSPVLNQRSVQGPPTSPVLMFCSTFRLAQLSLHEGIAIDITAACKYI